MYTFVDGQYDKLEIVWVFNKTDRLKLLYNKWNTRSFNERG